MSITLDALSAAVLTTAIMECGTDADLENENFLLNNVFKANGEVNATEDLKWGVDASGIFLIGYSRPGDSAVAVEKPGQKLKTLTIPNIRRKISIDRAFVAQLSVLVANYKGPLNMDPTSQLQQKIYKLALRLRTMIHRQTEVSAASALATGQFAVLDEKAVTIDTVDFLYTGNGTLNGDEYTIQKTLSGGNKWNTATGNPPKDVRRLRRAMKRYTHWAGPCYILAGWEALDFLVNNSITAAQFDNKAINVGGLTYTEQALIRGSVAGIPVMEYDLVWDTSSGKSEGWNSKTIALIPATSNLFSVEFGPVFDFPNDNPQSIPELIHTPYFSKTVRHEDPPSADIIAESNPMPVVWNPNAVRILRVA